MSSAGPTAAAAGASRKGRKGPGHPAEEALGRSRGGYGTKTCVVADARGRAVAFVIAPGRAQELPLAPGLLDARSGSSYYLDEEDRLITVPDVDAEPQPVTGALGQGTVPLREAAVSRDENRAAGVTEDGTALLVTEMWGTDPVPEALPLSAAPGAEASGSAYPAASRRVAARAATLAVRARVAATAAEVSITLASCMSASVPQSWVRSTRCTTSSAVRRPRRPPRT